MVLLVNMCSWNNSISKPIKILPHKKSVFYVDTFVVVIFTVFCCCLLKLLFVLWTKKLPWHCFTLPHYLELSPLTRCYSSLFILLSVEWFECAEDGGDCCNYEIELITLKNHLIQKKYYKLLLLLILGIKYQSD